MARIIDVRNATLRRDGSFAEYVKKEKQMSKESNNPEPSSTEVKDKIMPSVPAKSPYDQNSPTERLITEAIKGEYSYGKLGLILGLSSIIGGIILGLNGVAGSTSWTAKLLGLESRINDAAPGVVLFVVGLFMVWTTKPRVKLRDLKDD